MELYNMEMDTPNPLKYPQSVITSKVKKQRNISTCFVFFSFVLLISSHLISQCSAFHRESQFTSSASHTPKNERKSNPSSSWKDFLPVSISSENVRPFEFIREEVDTVVRDVLHVFGEPSYPAAIEECETNAYPPIPTDPMDEFVINLDLPPSKRWTKLAEAKKYEMVNLLKYLENFTHPLFNGNIVKTVDQYFPYLGDSLPHPFREEIKGLSQATGIPLGQMVLYNIFYEIFSVCTSIIIQMPDGTLAHGRNLDFGLFLGWNTKTENWMTTEYLKPLIVTLRFERKGKSVFRSVNFAGYIGVLTGVKPNSFTLTVNERFSIRGGFVGILEWIVGDRSGNWMGFLTRTVMENATDYNEAQKLLTKSELLAPAYFILGGNQSNEGCIITRDAKKYDILPLGFENASPVQNFSWFLVQTNYDHWNKPPFFDDRLTPAVNCLNRSERSDTPWKILYNALSTRPVLNKLTTYTAMMQVSGWMEVYIRNCSDPCWPW